MAFRPACRQAGLPAGKQVLRCSFVRPGRRDLSFEILNHQLISIAMDLNFLSPKSIAVIGASTHKEKLGYQVLRNIQKNGFKGKIYPININPKIKKILGLKNHTSVTKVKKEIDLAVIIIPAKFVPQVLEECGQKKVKGAIIISAGFSEIGKKGLKLEREIIKISKKYKIRVLGPNCLGYIDTGICLNASFAPTMPKKGNVAVISQSGAVCTAILDWALASNIGFSRFFSLGNKSDINELDLLSYLQKDKNTKVIIVYLENIAYEKQGKNFRQIALSVTNKKPLIIFKAGITEAGARAIASHTGALAGSNEAVTALFKQSGIIRAKSLEDMFDWAEAFSQLTMPKGNRVAIITNAGGPGVMSTDAIEKTRLHLASLKNNTIKKLEKTLPPAASTHNPIDVIGDANAIRYKNALDITEADPNVDSILILLTPQTATEIKKTANIILKKIKQSKKTIVPVFMGGEKVSQGIKIFEKESKAVFEYPERAIQALEKITFYQKYKKLFKEIPSPKILKINRSINQQIRRIIEREKTKSNLITGAQADYILKQYKIPILKSRLATDAKQAVLSSKKIGFPVVFKIDSPDIIHKSEVGGVIVGIKTEKQAEIAYKQIIKNIKKNRPKARINGIIIYEMISSGQEFYIGAKHNIIYGPLIGFGLGGIYIEVLKDVSFRLAPLSTFDIEKMLGELRSKKIIEGARGKKPLYKKGIVDVLIKISNLMINHPQIQELDINPLMVTEERVIALDNRFIISK